MTLPPETSRPRGLVLGLGNLMRRDDGLGVYAVRRFRAAYRYPASVRVVEGGVGGLSLLPRLQEVTHLVVLDAIQAPQAPGTLVQATVGQLASRPRAPLSVHDLNGETLLLLARQMGWLPSHHRLLGLVPASVALGEGLTPPVAQRLDELVAALAATLREWGFEVVRRNSDEAPPEPEGIGPCTNSPSPDSC